MKIRSISLFVAILYFGIYLPLSSTDIGPNGDDDEDAIIDDFDTENVR